MTNSMKKSQNVNTGVLHNSKAKMNGNTFTNKLDKVNKTANGDFVMDKANKSKTDVARLLREKYAKKN